MTIDEAIEKEYELSKDCPKDYINVYHKQIAEWLEDYKQIKMMIPLEQALNNEYNKAIDDSLEELEKIYQHCVEMHDWNGQAAINEAIETIEQLKVGGENE